MWAGNTQPRAHHTTIDNSPETASPRGCSWCCSSPVTGRVGHTSRSNRVQSAAGWRLGGDCTRPGRRSLATLSSRLTAPRGQFASSRHRRLFDAVVPPLSHAPFRTTTPIVPTPNRAHATARRVSRHRHSPRRLYTNSSLTTPRILLRSNFSVKTQLPLRRLSTSSSGCSAKSSALLNPLLMIGLGSRAAYGGCIQHRTFFRISSVWIN